MMDTGRTFAVASDEVFVGMISCARHRLGVVAPALTRAVADALSRRLDDLDQLDLTVILDSDPQVYHLGFGGDLRRGNDPCRRTGNRQLSWSMIDDGR